MNIINNSEVLGSLGKDLVLNTLGKVYIRVGDRYYELDFRNNISPASNNIETESDDISQSKSDVLIVKNTKNLEYPGDGKLIISLDGKFLISYNGKFKDITPLKNPIKTDSVNISIIEDADVIGQLKSDNLVLDFNSGEIVADSITVNNLTVNNLNSLSNTNNQIDRYIKGSGKLYIGSEINVLKIDEDDDYVIFYVNLKDVSLFPIGSIVTNQYENFEGEVISVSENRIKVKVVSKVECEDCTDIYDTKILVLKGDYISYDKTWGSVYNKKYNIRFGEVVKSGDYSDYELLIVNGDYDIVAKSGILIKCTKDCSISVNIDGIQNTYSLKQGSVYLLSSTRKISITDEIYTFETESDFKNANTPYDSIAFIKDTKQIYYKDIIVGGKQDAALPDNFKIDNAVNGAIIVKQNGTWQPSYDYATTNYVDTKIRNILGDSSDALNTLKEISNILQDNTNNIGDILSAINDLNKKVEEKADKDEFDSEVERINLEIKKINSLLTINDISKLNSILESKASIESLNNLEQKLSQYVTKDYFESTILDLKFQTPVVPEASNSNKEIEALKNKDIELGEKIDSLRNNQGNILNSIDSLLNSDINFNNRIENILDRIIELESYTKDDSNFDLSIKVGDVLYKSKDGVIELPENKGLDEEEINNYLVSEGYATQKWVLDKKYALVSDVEKIEDSCSKLWEFFTDGSAKNALKLDGHSADYFATADALNTHIKAFNTYKTTTDDRLNKLEDLWYMDKEGNVHTTHNIVVDRGGAFGMGAESGGDVGGFGKVTIYLEGSNIPYESDASGKIVLPAYPSLSGYATENWVSNNYQPKGNYLTSVSWDIVSGKPSFAAVATSGKYSDLSGLPTIPTDTNQLNNSAGYITSAALNGYATQTWVEGKKYLTAHQSIYSLTINNSAGTAQVAYTPNSRAASLTLTKAMVGLSNVENTALSTWTGSAKITTLGTITSGTWNGTKISNNYLSNSSITIAGTSVSLGSSISTSTLQSNLGLKALAYKDSLVPGDIPDISATYVTISTSQTISGAKTFGASIAANGGIVVPSTKSIKIGDAEFTWNGSALHINKNLAVAGGGAFGSDIRYKDVISHKQLDLETIAKAPLFTFKWTDREDKVEHLGTSAQYWLDTEFKDAVNITNPKFYHLDYGALAVGIGISVAREVKGVKTEVELLRDEVRQLKEKLNKYEQVWHN